MNQSVFPAPSGEPVTLPFALPTPELATPDPAAPDLAAPVADAERDEVRELARHCMGYRDAIDARAWTQVAVTLSLYLGLCAVLIGSMMAGFYPALVLAIPAGMLLVRVFTLQHDCGHGSFFSRKDWNTGLGRALSVLTFTPYGFWKRTHAMHHSSAGDLGRRGVGDVDTYTVREYEALSPLERWRYRLYRHPLVLHVVGPPIYFLLIQRSPWGQALTFGESWRSITALNIALVAFYGGLMAAFGWVPVLLALLPVACVTTWVGAWLFFVQHQFEDTHWEESEEWHLQTAALHGSSHYVLPAWANWLTGDIGLHHIHHLNSRVPNYRLRECMRGDPRLEDISRLTFRESLACIGLSLWDEDAKRLVTFEEAARG